MIIAIPFLAAADDVSWRFQQEVNGVSIYKRPFPDSDVAMFKGISIVDASVAVIAEILRDLPAYPQWMANVMLGRVEKYFDPNSMIVYNIIDFPWPATDRDAVLKSETSVDDKSGEIIVTSRAMANYPLPKNEKLVRTDKLIQKFVLEFIEKDKTRVSYIIHIDPKGNLPASLVNTVLKDVPGKSLANLKHMVRKDKYQQADPLDQNNLETTRKVVAAHLKRFIKDESVIEKFCMNRDLIRFAIDAGTSKAGIRRIMEKLRTSMGLSGISHKPS
jgi:hypothetical protein